jgi:hypothetical protein
MDGGPVDQAAREAIRSIDAPAVAPRTGRRRPALAIEALLLNAIYWTMVSIKVTRVQRFARVGHRIVDISRRSGRGWRQRYG